MSSSESVQFHERIVEKFKIQKNMVPYWEQISSEMAQHDPQGWKKASEFIDKVPICLYFDEYVKASVFEFNSPDDLELVLAETTGFVFYASPIDLRVIVNFNDHDMLILMR